MKKILILILLGFGWVACVTKRIVSSPKTPRRDIVLDRVDAVILEPLKKPGGDEKQ